MYLKVKFLADVTWNGENKKQKTKNLKGYSHFRKMEEREANRTLNMVK